jgi:enamine deaminase RidA (YjgF/YER057c/UK114 family)
MSTSAPRQTSRILQPAGWKRPKGYANGVEATGRQVYVAGQIGWNAQQVFENADLLGQVRQTLENVVAVVAEAGGEPTHITTMTWYVLDRRDYLRNVGAIGEIYRSVVGRHFPAMAVVEVSGLMEDAALVEIQAIAVIPQG